MLVVDQRIVDMTGIELIEQASAVAPVAKRVLLTTYQDSEAAVAAIKRLTIDHYLLKPWQPPEQNLYPALDDLLLDWEAGVRPPFEGLRVGYRFSPESHQTRDFLASNCVPFEWLDLQRDPEARRLVDGSGLKASDLPLLQFPDGTKLVRPANAQIAEKLGLRVRPTSTFYDLVIVGGGPAGLAAAVYGASEGLRTVMVERHAPGGQATLSSMIENYLGFPAGNVMVRLRTTVVAVHGTERLETITVADAATGKHETLRASALFIFIGGKPNTTYVEDMIRIQRPRRVRRRRRAPWVREARRRGRGRGRDGGAIHTSLPALPTACIGGRQPDTWRGGHRRRRPRRAWRTSRHRFRTTGHHPRSILWVIHRAAQDHVKSLKEVPHGRGNYHEDGDPSRRGHPAGRDGRARVGAARSPE